MALITIWFFAHKSFCSNKAATFQKNLQKKFAFFFESQETTPFSFNNILDCLPLLGGISRDFKYSPNIFGIIFVICIFALNFFPYCYKFLSESFVCLKWSLSTYLPHCLNFCIVLITVVNRIYPFQFLEMWKIWFLRLQSFFKL